MSNYALVENGNIKVQMDNLPESWKNISGLHHSKNDEFFLNSVGWYTIVKEQVELQPDEHIVGYNLNYENNKVIGIPVVRNKTVNENSQADKERAMNKLREARNDLLRKCDWTQLEDVKKTKSQEWIDSWELYRDQLRQIPSWYEDSNITDVSQVSWPEPPSV